MASENQAAMNQDPYDPDWVKGQNLESQSNPQVASSTVTARTAYSSGTSYPSDSDLYTPQPSQISESAEIAKKKTQEENQKKGGGGAIGGAAAVAGIAGLCLVGPITAVAVAGGAAYVAATNKGVAGKAFRASGTAATTVGSSARNFDKKHQVVSKTSRGIATGVGGIARGVGWINGKVRRQPKGSSNPQAAAADLTN